jgi:uroporphyrinogen-III synthase
MRILLTRAQEDAERSARFLRRLGCEPVLAPVIVTRDGDEPPPAGGAEAFDAVIVTSAKAAPHVKRFGVGAPALPVFAVGPRTARALGAQGLREVHVSAGDALALLRDIPRILPAPARLLHVAGRDRKAEPAQSLRAMGYGVTIWTAYEAQALEALPEAAIAALEGDEVDAALHYSPRSARILLDLARRADLMPALSKLDHIAISPDVEAVLRQGGLDRVAAAATPNEKAMFRVVVDIAGRRERREGRLGR